LGLEVTGDHEDVVVAHTEFVEDKTMGVEEVAEVLAGLKGGKEGVLRSGLRGRERGFVTFWFLSKGF
jgi:hypothetical protein